jgi:hypothetical protein
LTKTTLDRGGVGQVKNMAVLCNGVGAAAPGFGARSFDLNAYEVFESLLNFTGKICIRQTRPHDRVAVLILVLRQNQADGEGIAANTFFSKHVFYHTEDQGMSEFLVFGRVAAAAARNEIKPLDVLPVFE